MGEKALKWVTETVELLTYLKVELLPCIVPIPLASCVLIRLRAPRPILFVLAARPVRAEQLLARHFLKRALVHQCLVLHVFTPQVRPKTGDVVAELFDRVTSFERHIAPAGRLARDIIH